MKKILVVGMSDNIGGVETYFHNYYRYFDRKKYHFDFVTICGTIAFSDEYERNGSKIFKLPNYIKRPLAYYRKMHDIIRNGKYDIVHINMLSAANILPVKAALVDGISKVIVHSHNTDIPKGLLRRILHKVNKRVLSDPRLVRLACAKAAGKWLFGETDFVIVNNAIDTEKFKFSLKNRKSVREKYDISDDTFLIGNIGRICEQKNQIFLVKMLKKIENEKIKLMIVGSGDKESMLTSMIEMLNLKDRVIIVPMAQNIEKYYSAFDVFALPSKFEGMPVVLVEAQANGLKTLISDKILEYPNAKNTVCLRAEDLDLWSSTVSVLSLNNIERTDEIEAELLNNYDARLQRHKMLEVYNV